jgi:multisite-specific tRNA:(cytosine-C5)-methyltransferase
VRNPGGESARQLYLTNDLVRRVVQNNEFTRIRLMTAGIKVFTRQDGGFGKGRTTSTTLPKSTSQFRLLSEGVTAVLPFIREEAILDADVNALRVLMSDYYPLLASFEESFQKTLEPKRKVFCFFSLTIIKSCCSSWKPCRTL